MVFRSAQRCRMNTNTAAQPPAPPAVPPPPPPPPPPLPVEPLSGGPVPAKKTGFWLVDYGGVIGFAMAASFLGYYLYRQKSGQERRQALVRSIEDAAAVCPGEVKDIRSQNKVPYVRSGAPCGSVGAGSRSPVSVPPAASQTFAERASGCGPPSPPAPHRLRSSKRF